MTVVPAGIPVKSIAVPEVLACSVPSVKPLAVAAIVTVSVPAVVVIVIFEPAANVKVSPSASATTSLCPLTATVPKLLIGAGKSVEVVLGKPVLVRTDHPVPGEVPLICPSLSIIFHATVNHPRNIIDPRQQDQLE